MMSKEWILNSVMNRFKLNYKRSVGAVAEEIRKCSPKTLDVWEEYYFSHVKSQGYIESLGRKLYAKTTEVVPAEIESITEEDCIRYMHSMVIDRTFDGYETEIKTIYGQLQEILKIEIKPAPDIWDRLYNVDFYIEIRDKYIGLQIKPAAGTSHIPQIFTERLIQAASHKKFEEEFGGKVFYVISTKEGRAKKIFNIEVIQQIQEEIKRLQTDQHKTVE